MIIYKDKGPTGRLEITVYKNNLYDEEPEKGKMIYSKLISGKFPHNNWEYFVSQLDGSISDTVIIKEPSFDLTRFK